MSWLLDGWERREGWGRGKVGSDGSSLTLGPGSSFTPRRAAQARVLQAPPIYRVGQASGSSLRHQARAWLELGIWRLNPSLKVGGMDG